MRRGNSARRVARAACVAMALPCLLAMQRPAIGGAVARMPALDLQGADRPLQEFAGPRGLVVFFWAGWSARSTQELTRLDAAQRELRDRGLGIVAVNVDHESGKANLAAVEEQAASLGVSMPVVADDGLKLFKAYGVVSVPSTALVNEKGELVYFLAGYGHAQREELFDAIDRLAGVAQTAPAGPAVRAAPAAHRRLLFGRAQLAGGRVAAARSSFEAAAAADPAYADPLVELAALEIDEGNADAAKAWLDKALAVERDNTRAQAEAARLLFVAGQTSEALAALGALAGREPLAAGYLEIAQSGEADAARRMQEWRRSRPTQPAMR